MESQPQNPESRNNPDNFYPCYHKVQQMLNEEFHDGCHLGYRKEWILAIGYRKESILAILNLHVDSMSPNKF